MPKMTSILIIRHIEDPVNEVRGVCHVADIEDAKFIFLRYVEKEIDDQEWLKEEMEDWETSCELGWRRDLCDFVMIFIKNLHAPSFAQQRTDAQ